MAICEALLNSREKPVLNRGGTSMAFTELQTSIDRGALRRAGSGTSSRRASRAAAGASVDVLGGVSGGAFYILCGITASVSGKSREVFCFSMMLFKFFKYFKSENKMTPILNNVFQFRQA